MATRTRGEISGCCCGGTTCGCCSGLVLPFFFFDLKSASGSVPPCFIYHRQGLWSNNGSPIDFCQDLVIYDSSGFGAVARCSLQFSVFNYIKLTLSCDTSGTSCSDFRLTIEYGPVDDIPPFTQCVEQFIASPLANCSCNPFYLEFVFPAPTVVIDPNPLLGYTCGCPCWGSTFRLRLGLEAF